MATRIHSLLAGIIGCLLCCQLALARDVLRVLAWPGYADRDVVQAFEQRYQASVEVTFVDSDEALWAHMHAPNGPRFDVVAANTAEMQRYYAAGLLKPLDPALLPNTRRQLPRFRQLAAIPGLQQRGRLYAVPYTYSTMGIIYDKRQFSRPPDSMNVLWDRRYRHKVLDFNSGQHNFSFAALASGISQPFQLSAAQQAMLVQRLIALRRNVLTYYTLPEEASELFIRHRIAVMFGNYGTQQLNSLRQAGADVGYAIPREGVLAWLDCWAMTVAARKPLLAQQWINYMLEPSVSALLPTRQGLANTLSPSNELTAGARVLWLQPVEDAARREALWQKIYSGDRPGSF
ncbi:ABC transporter, periplasmic spermidine putrescine-binding protein PotD [Aquitalea magnusonii]|uniref:ABC transporter, periplasmic spermidine putrescine-binding protein PotD n=1 Tax=Aquitalea magnusonii TaxID=332411 RepID=A0A3G9GMI9_9NEIS|nr:extracellular solute-binding protein [Aquitalea magnusonii]BBF86537.1 ABC transporter, periplasmic spermidine putrescine-binding protein PotD [Aquitalea magnusonii]